MTPAEILRYTWPMAYRTEVWIPSRSVWIEHDVHYGTEGERMMSRVQYEQAVLRRNPILKDGQNGYHSFRRYRISEFAAPKMPKGIPIRIPELAALGQALARKARRAPQHHENAQPDATDSERAP